MHDVIDQCFPPILLFSSVPSLPKVHAMLQGLQSVAVREIAGACPLLAPAFVMASVAAVEIAAMTSNTSVQVSEYTISTCM